MISHSINPLLVNEKKERAFQYILLAVITLLAFGLRVYKLGEWSFWVDEIATINRAYGHFNLETIIYQWWRPPFSVILTGGLLKILGTNELSARLASVLIGSISIPILFFLCKKLFDPWVGIAVGLLLAVSPWHIFWSQNARFYTSLMLFYFISSVALFLFIERGQTRYLLLFGFFFFFALGERYIAILLIPVLFAYLFALWVFPFGKPAGFNRKTITLLFLPGVALAALETYSYLTTGTTRLGFSLDTFMGRPIDSPFRILILIIYNLGIPLFVMSSLSSFLVFTQKNRAALFFLLSAIVPTVLTIAASQFAFVVDRYVFITLPGWIILCVYGIRMVSRSINTQGMMVPIALLTILIADAGGHNVMYYQINHGNRPEWRKAFEFVADELEEGDQVVSSVPQLGSYYLKQDVLGLGDIQPDELVGKNQRVWFVLDSENSWFSAPQKLWVEEHADFIEVFYLRVRETINLKIYLYTPQYEKP